MNSISYKHKIILLIMFVFGFALILPYGAHLDQVTEQEILYSNVLEAFGKIGIWDSLCKELEAINIVPIGHAIDRDHGASALYPMFWIYYVNDKSTYIGNIIWHAYIYLICFIGVLALYKLCSNMYGPRTALYTSLIYFLTPRIFAEMHYNNKDMVLLSLTIMMFYLAERLKRDTSIKNAVLFGMIGAFLTNMRIIGLFMWGLVGLYIAIYKLFSCKEKISIFAKITLSIITAAVCFYIITPAIWGNIKEYIEYCIESSKDYRWDDYVLFMGNHYSKIITGFPGKYLPITIMLTLPAGVLLFALIGCVYSMFSLVKKDNLSNTAFCILLALSGFIPVAFAVINRTPLYNGWRHFYFAYAAIIVMVACGINALFVLEKKKNATTAVIISYCIVLLVGIIINHPYEYAYYNIFVGNDVESNYELDYWDMSIKQALEYVANNNDNVYVSIAACDNPTLWGVEAQLAAVRGKKRGYISIEENIDKADFIIINRTYSELYSKEQYEKIKTTREKCYEILSYGNVLCEVYK